MPPTLAQKISASPHRYAGEQDGQIVQCRVSAVLANDITGPLAIKSFHGMGAERVFNRDRVILVMDHFTPQKDIDSANQVLISRKFAQEQNLTHYYEGGDCGVEHTLLPEQGLVGPGDLVIGADSHTCTYGGIGAFATGMGSTDIAAAMALGETWLKVPPTIRVTITGSMPKWLRGKDLMLMLIGAIGVDGALYKALEFAGPVVDNLSVEGRLCMANMAIEAGAKVGLCRGRENPRLLRRAQSAPASPMVWPPTRTRFMKGWWTSMSRAKNRWWPVRIALNVKPVSEVRRHAHPAGGHRLLHQRPHRRYARRGAVRGRGWIKKCAASCCPPPPASGGGA